MSLPERYDAVAMLLHWAMFILILVLFMLGWYMVDLPKDTPERTYFFALHKSTGLTLAALLVLRVAWRLKHAPPTLPESLAAWQRRLAEATHYLLYVCMLLQP
ncbi:MAG: cytochrome b, partial [Gammaproteobacteria bacterium]